MAHEYAVGDLVSYDSLIGNVFARGEVEQVTDGGMVIFRISSTRPANLDDPWAVGQLISVEKRSPGLLFIKRSRRSDSPKRPERSRTPKRRSQHGGGLKLKTIRKSHRAEKKFDAVFDKDGKEKIVSFGAAGMSNYTKHKNATRKQRYLKRHTGKGEKWQEPDTPGALSRWVLWNKPSFRDSVADFKKRFNL